MVKPHVEVKPRGRQAKRLAEDAFDVAAGIADARGEILHREGFLDVAFHQLDHGGETGIAQLCDGGKRGALARVAADADAAQAHVEDHRRESIALVAADDVDHQVGRRGPAARGEDAVVDLELGLRRGEGGEHFAEGGLVLPVQREAAVGEKACTGQREGAGAKSGNRAAMAVVALDGRDDAGGHRLGRLVPGADHKRCVARRCAEGAVDLDGQAAGRGDGLAVGGGRAPGVERPLRKLVGDAQRLDRRSEGEEGEGGADQEVEGPGRRVGARGLEIGRARRDQRGAVDGHAGGGADGAAVGTGGGFRRGHQAFQLGLHGIRPEHRGVLVQPACREDLFHRPAMFVAAVDGVVEADRGFADLQDRQPEGERVAEERGFGKIAAEVDGGGAPAFVPDDFVPGPADMGPELFDHAVQDVEIGGVIGGARDVAIAEMQRAVGGEADGHRMSPFATSVARFDIAGQGLARGGDQMERVPREVLLSRGFA